MKYSKRKIKLSFERVDDPTIITDFKLLSQYKALLSKLTRQDPEHGVLSSQLHDLRIAMKAKPHSLYKLQVNNGKWFNEMHYNELPDPMGFKEVVDDIDNDLKELRAEAKKVKPEIKNIMGFSYQTVGGVFQAITDENAVSKHNIVAIGKTTDPMRRIGNEKAPHERMQANFVGIELELMSVHSREILAQEFIKEQLAGYVQIKTDSSIRVENGDERGHEVTVLCRQDMVEDIMTRVCRVLNGAAKAKVNNSCGFHLHLDMRRRDPYKAYNNLVKALPLLNSLVPPIRVTGEEARRYCRQNSNPDLKSYFPDPTKIKGSHSVSSENRYQAINPLSLTKFNTIEIRMHSGTTNAVKTIMWTKICAAIADADHLLERINTVSDFERLVLNDSKVSEYINKRVTLFATKKDAIDTRADWALDMMEVG